MKKILFAFLTAGMFVFSSCADECKDVTCENGGTCNEGVCECAEGYEGDACETETRAKFLGNYTVSSSCAAGSSWNSTITASGTGTLKILLGNFSHLVCNSGDIIVTATVNGSNLTIDNQVVCSTNFSGTGSITNNGLTISLKATPSGGSEENCTETWTKQ